MASEAALAYNLGLEHELLRLLDRFERSGIPTVVLKGFPLARRLGLPIHARRMSDNDLLVRAADVRAAVEVLRASEYEECRAYPLEGSLRTNFQHPMGRRSAVGSFFVDVHWHALSPTHFHLSEAAVWENTETVLLQGTAVRVLNPKFTLLHCAGHFVQSTLNEERILVTLGAAWSRWREEVSVPELMVEARAAGMRASLEYSLHAAAALGHTSHPLPVTEPRARLLELIVPAHRLAEPRLRPDYERRLLSWLLLDTEKAATQLRRALLPPIAEVQSYLPEHGVRSVIAEYLARPGRILRRWSAQRRR